MDASTAPQSSWEADSAAARAAPIVIESCHSTWVFDATRSRFQRIPKGLDLSSAALTAAWQPYYGLELEEGSDSFVVQLDPQGTRLLRSWRHLEGGCEWCGEHRTTQLSLDDVRRQPD